LSLTSASLGKYDEDQTSIRSLVRLKVALRCKAYLSHCFYIKCQLLWLHM